jgi:ABC-type nitrate/sulfonate/bicarbonate transport system ATPase subunit
MESAKLLRNVDLDIYEGDLVVLLGLSGSGKSTNDRVFLHEDHDAGVGLIGVAESRPPFVRTPRRSFVAKKHVEGFAMACATATLCCSPLDNCEGK